MTSGSERAAGTAQAEPEEPAVALLELRDGLPPVTDTDAALADVVAALAAGSGPVAVDAERASGHRYSARAYLVQLRRRGAGTALVDPIAFPSLSSLGGALGDAEWVLHAASQDLACLAEVGIRPRLLFDTELAGRLLNYPKVGLASMVEDLLGYRMRKEHSAADWSRRPLPQTWLRYAALDVEMLLELRDVIAEQLSEQGKAGWAEQEFAALAAQQPAEPRTERWRRTSGIQRIRGRRGLATVRELWETRDAVARERDIAPGRILKDAAICEISTAQPTDRAALAALASFRDRGAARYLDRWLAAVDRARRISDTELPALSARYEGPPPARSWAERSPAAAGRLSLCREVMRELSDVHAVPVENLLAPDAVRRLAWEPPAPASASGVAQLLSSRGAREWQVLLTARLLADALSAGPADGKPLSGSP